MANPKLPPKDKRRFKYLVGWFMVGEAKGNRPRAESLAREHANGRAEQ